MAKFSIESKFQEWQEACHPNADQDTKEDMRRCFFSGGWVVFERLSNLGNEAITTKDTSVCRLGAEIVYEEFKKFFDQVLRETDPERN